MKQCIQGTFDFQCLDKRKFQADFDGGDLSPDGGVVLIREIDLQLGLTDQLSECFTDFRDPDWVEHPLPDLLRQRIFGISLGYEDLNDHESLRVDPVFAAGVGKNDPLGNDRRSSENRGKALAGQSTLNRLENTNSKTRRMAAIESGAHKIRACHELIEGFLIKLAVDMLAEDTAEIVLDFDATDSLIHGNQEGKFFHGYYDSYCFMPLYCFIGPWPVWAQLRTSNRDASDGTVEALAKIVPVIRQRFPEAKIILRADSGFARESIFTWCEDNDLYYVIGLAKNAVLLRELEPTMFRSKADASLRGGHCTYFCDFTYRTQKSWSQSRRVIGKAQVNPKGENPRFIVTNLDADEAQRWEPEPLYRDFYCARGDMENRIKEQQLDLFADRMSSAAIETNQLRLWFSTFAYILIVALRERGLKKSKTFSTASPSTIRDRLLKIATLFKSSVRRVMLHFSSSFRYQEDVSLCVSSLKKFCPTP